MRKVSVMRCPVRFLRTQASNPLSVVDPKSVGMCPDRLTKLTKWLDGLVDDGKLPCVVAAVARKGKTVLVHTKGSADVANGKPVKKDSIFRIHSMTKPITSLAAMILYEQGKFLLDDPIKNWLPEFRTMEVLESGSAAKYDTVHANKPITIRHLLTHTAGFTYPFIYNNTVDHLYRIHDIDFSSGDTREMVKKLAKLPLLFQPGSKWNYGVATDVLGVLVSEVAGEPLDQFIEKHILKPLDMKDTGFYVPESEASRLVNMYAVSKRKGGMHLLDPPSPDIHQTYCSLGKDCKRDPCYQLHPDGRPTTKPSSYPPSPYLSPRNAISGGGGLVSTVGDYMRFCNMVINKGTLDGQRIVGPRTMELMVANQLQQDLEHFGTRQWSEGTFRGIGFGFGWSVVADWIRADTLLSNGSLSWGGTSSTHFFIDPKHEVSLVFLTQLFPSYTYKELRPLMQILTMQAMTE